MIKPKAMNKITVFGPNNYLKKVIGTMYEHNVVHIDDHTKKSEEDFFDIGEPFKENESYAENLVKIRAIISNLDIKKTLVKTNSTSIEIINSKTNEIYEQIAKLLQNKEYFAKLKSFYDKNEIEKSISNLKIEENEDPNFKDFQHYIGYVKLESENLKEEIEKITNKAVLFSTNYQATTLFAIFAPENKKDKIGKLLENYDFSPIDNPVLKEKFNLNSKSAVKFVKLDHEAEIIETKLNKIEHKISEFKDEHSKFLLESELKLKIESEKAEAPLRFASTKNTFLIKGWIPKKDSKNLEKDLDKITNGKVHLEFHKPTKKDNVPIAFNHPKIVEPFEAFMNLYSLPSYKEIDPTFFMFLTFPFFFGFMLGDVGYGLVIFALFSILKKKMPGAKNFINAFLIAAVVSIVMGMAFGEYFGFEEVSPQIGQMLGIHPHTVTLHGETEILYTIPHIFARSHGINDLLSIAILFGIVHVFIGYIIGFINIKKEHGLKHAILEKVGWMLLFPGVIYLLTDFLGVVTGFVKDMLAYLIPPMPIMGGLALLGVILIIKGEGAQGAVELPALISNILSYARLMAVGLASLSLAVVVNNLAGDMFKGGIVGIIGGIIILILGHSINIALGILSPFLHSLRLHYVEFFTKFFKGGGKRYVSFGHSK